MGLRRTPPVALHHFWSHNYLDGLFTKLPCIIFYKKMSERKKIMDAISEHSSRYLEIRWRISEDLGVFITQPLHLLVLDILRLILDQIQLEIHMVIITRVNLDNKVIIFFLWKWPAANHSCVLLQFLLDDRTLLTVMIIAKKWKYILPTRCSNCVTIKTWPRRKSLSPHHATSRVDEGDKSRFQVSLLSIPIWLLWE